MTHKQPTTDQHGRRRIPPGWRVDMALPAENTGDPATEKAQEKSPDKVADHYTDMKSAKKEQ